MLVSTDCKLVRKVVSPITADCVALGSGDTLILKDIMEVRFGVDGRQPFLYPMTEGLPVIRQESRVSARSVPASRLPGTNLLDEWIGDLPLIAEVVASQLAKITCPTGRQYIENRFQRQSASPGP